MNSRPRAKGFSSRRAALLCLAAILCATVALERLLHRVPVTARPPAPEGQAVAEAPGGSLRHVNGYRVLELSGTPEEMGATHGRLLRAEIQRVVRDLLPENGSAAHRRLIEAVRVMEPFQPERYRRELRALAQAAEVDYLDAVAIQLFGDAERGRTPRGRLPDPDAIPDPRQPPADPRGPSLCTSYAVFGPATATGELIVGRNFDFFYPEVNRYAATLIHYRPDQGRSFVTVTWAGIINGWTLMNDAGLVTANNSASGSHESLEGIATCFMLRHVIENAATVDEGIALVRKGPRAVGTIMLIAGGAPPDAVEIEFDHEQFAVRRAHRGFVMACNAWRALFWDKPVGPEEEHSPRYGALLRLILRNYGRIDRRMNFAAASGVALRAINLHSALLFPSDLTFAVSMGACPAVDQPYRRFRMTPEGIRSAESEAW